MHYEYEIVEATLVPKNNKNQKMKTMKFELEKI